MANTNPSESAPSANSLSLGRLDPRNRHSFVVPVKKIHDGPDVSFFLSSKAYGQIMTFLLQLNASLYPRIIPASDTSKEEVQSFDIGSPNVQFSETVLRLRELLRELEEIIDEAPPDPGPRRFGNVSFRKWFQFVEARLPALLQEFVPETVLSFGHPETDAVQAQDELSAYLLGSFGSAQRLDYGTGHELSFLAFLAGIWVLGGFPVNEPGVEERGIVLGVIEPYLNLIRRLIKIYTLEPAGSHGVWGLDDHSFQPYVFGSAQFCPPVSRLDQIPSEGSIPGAPDPAGVAKNIVVQRERKRNMYFSAIGFIYDVKKGPFWEHSPYLFDISGVRGGWAKINKGMIKMYNAEVLSKFPVVQHFPFGSLFKWEQDPQAFPAPQSAHTLSQPLRSTPASSQESNASLDRTTAQVPQSSLGISQMPQTSAPWAKLPSVAPISTRPAPPRRRMEPSARADRGISASTTGNIGDTLQTRGPRALPGVVGSDSKLGTDRRPSNIPAKQGESPSQDA